MCGRRLCGPCGGTGSACVCVFQACGRSGGRVGRSRSCGRCHPVMWSMHAHVVEVPRSGGPCPSLMWARHDRSGGPCPSLMWARHALSIAQVVHVPRSCGPCMKRPSLMWAPVAHVGPRRSCGPPSLMWAWHEMAEKSPLLHGEAVACPALPRPVWWRRPNT